MTSGFLGRITSGHGRQTAIHQANSMDARELSRGKQARELTWIRGLRWRLRIFLAIPVALEPGNRNGTGAVTMD